MAESTICIKPLSQQFTEEDIRKAFQGFELKKIHLSPTHSQAFV